MAPSVRYGKVRAETERIAMEAAIASRRNAGWAKIWPDVIALFKDGDRLCQTEQEWLQEWMQSQSMEGIRPSEIQTVQLARDEVARMLGGNDRSADLALRSLQTIGLLQLIRKGKRGHASLYCVLPLPASGLPPPQLAGVLRRGF